MQIALANPHLTGGGFDLPEVAPIFEDYVEHNGLARRLPFSSGSFFTDEVPPADVITMGHILHDWDLEQKRMLIGKACDALPDGGALIVYEAIIDDDRSQNAFGLLMSLNMLIDTEGGSTTRPPTLWAGCARPDSLRPGPSTSSAPTRW